MGFQQGLSGLNTTAKNLEVIGNNVANANTFGNKASRAEFADMYATAMNGSGANNIGIGVSLAAVSQQFTQGNLTSTESPLDLAINGAGFFQVTDGKSPTSYTRNGQFKIDKDGFIVNNQSLKLMGYPADGQGIIQPGLAKPLQLPTAGISPNPTSKITMEVNLDSRVKSTEQPAGGPAIDFKDPTTYNNATSVTVYDAKGQDVALTYYFQKATVTTDTTTTPPTTTGADLWNVYITANGQPLSGTAALPTLSLQVQFAANGGSPTFIPAPVAPAVNPTIDIPAGTNGAGAPTLAIAGVQLDFKGMTQYGANFAVTDLAQDGYAPGQLSGVTIENSGIIMARYSNGQSKPAGQVEIANFRNVQGLQPMGGNGWQRSFASGDPVVGVPGDGNLGALRSGTLEESNVDLTGELVNMITAQRIYQANAQTIKAEDQLLQTIVNLR
jgi:flagellar hook protein FlgE